MCSTVLQRAAQGTAQQPVAVEKPKSLLSSLLVAKRQERSASQNGIQIIR